MNFIDQCLSGDALEDEIDEYVARWHEGTAGLDQELHEYLGMTWGEYSLWATKPSILRYILSAHKRNVSLDFELNQERLSLAARAETAEEAMQMEAWLKLIGKL